jgi:cell division protein FtsX
MATSMLQLEPRDEFVQDPLLTVASVLLIVVSIGWVVVSRLVSRNLRRRAAQARRKVKRGTARPARDIWAEPPG